MNKLKPFFTYMGGKNKSAHFYPNPIGDTIIEPFAGSAGYAMNHFEKKVMLYDIDPVICGIWDYLIHTTEKDIDSLPIDFESLEELKLNMDAKNLIGFWQTRGDTSPLYTKGNWCKTGEWPNQFWGEHIRNRIRDQIKYIRHWKIYNKSYVQIMNRKSTWFVDPPYQGKSGKRYSFSNIDYTILAEWCKTRIGGVIVCEQQEADWLPFRILGSFPTISHVYNKELIWTQRNE